MPIPMHNLFYLILLLLPVNLAKHFILPSSYVSGILVDYLIPTVYLTDILIILLLVVRPIKKIPKTLIIFWLWLLLSVIFSHTFIPALYKYAKIIELSLFGLWIYQHQIKISMTAVIKIISLSALFQSLLALVQWFKQSSIFGYWFFGEQPYNAATAGIDKIIWFNGALKIPPLGTFTHPNVLAGFLVVSFSLTAAYWLKKSKLLFIVYLLLITFPLFLTFSLSGWLAFLFISIPLLLLSIYPKIKALMISAGLILITLSLSFNFSFLAPESSFTRRSQLNKISWQMLLDHPLVGVGLNNFIVSMEQYGYVSASTRFLQPVHNIYLLVLTESGLIGLSVFLCLLYKNFNKYLLIILFIGLFDHYFLTLQPSLLLLILLLAYQSNKTKLNFTFSPAR